MNDFGGKPNQTELKQIKKTQASIEPPNHATVKQLGLGFSQTIAKSYIEAH